MRKQIHVMIGTSPADWCEATPLGPFDSEAKARAAIREDIEQSMDGCGMLSPGTEDDWCERYTMVETLKTFQPRLTVTVGVALTRAHADL